MVKRTDVYKEGFLQGLKRAERIIQEALKRDNVQLVAKIREVECFPQNRDFNDIKEASYFEDLKTFSVHRFSFQSENEFLVGFSNILRIGSSILKNPQEYVDLFWHEKERAVCVRYHFDEYDFCLSESEVRERLQSDSYPDDQKEALYNPDKFVYSAFMLFDIFTKDGKPASNDVVKQIIKTHI